MSIASYDDELPLVGETLPQYYLLAAKGQPQSREPIREICAHSGSPPEENGTTHKKLCSVRWLMAFLGCLATIIMISAQVNISVALVCMVKTVNFTQGEFNWSKSDESRLLSAYFYGTLVTQIPGGWLAGRFGSTRVISGGMFVGALTSLLFPLFSRLSYHLAFALRILTGMSQGVVLPSLHSMWGHWGPPAEITQLTSVCFSGNRFGKVLAYPASACLCKYGFDNGWGSIFYITGGVSFLWCIVWLLVSSDKPEIHPFITEGEIHYITSSTGNPSKNLSTPWKNLLTSSGQWGCLIGNTCYLWNNYTIQTHMPLFFNEVAGFNLTTTGTMSSLPYITMGLSGLVIGHVSDHIRSKKWLSTANTRKLVQTVAFLGAACCLSGLGFVQKGNVIVLLITTASGFLAMTTGGVYVNALDFAPRFAGVIFGITGTAGSVAGMTAPVVAGYLTPHGTREEWRNVFLVCSGVCVLGTVAFVLLAQGEVQSWASETVEDKLKDKEQKKS